MTDDPWLVVIDPQRIFASPESPWGSPMFPDILPALRRLAQQYADRLLITRWVPPTRPIGSWEAYMQAWPMAAEPPDHPQFDVVEELRDLGSHHLTAATFGKWSQITKVTGPTPRLLLTGVSTDCCVLSTALPAADAGAEVTVLTDACAGSTPENHQAALAVLSLYPPQITLATCAEVLG